MDISLLGLDKVAVRLIEKVSGAAGVVYEPTRITRKAKHGVGKTKFHHNSDRLRSRIAALIRKAPDERVDELRSEGAWA